MKLFHRRSNPIETTLKNRDNRQNKIKNSFGPIVLKFDNPYDTNERIVVESEKLNFIDSFKLFDIFSVFMGFALVLIITLMVSIYIGFIGLFVLLPMLLWFIIPKYIITLSLLSNGMQNPVAFGRQSTTTFRKTYLYFSMSKVRAILFEIKMKYVP